MIEDPQNKAELFGLPPEAIDWLTKPFARFLRIEAAAGSILLLFTIAALILSNSPWSHPFLHTWETPVGIQIGSLEFTRSLREWINDALMTLFFFLVALELKRELILGELRNPRMAALSIVAAMGGMLVPTACYLILQAGQSGQHGWGIVMATDTAFVIGCLALFGSRIPKVYAYLCYPWRLLTISGPFWWLPSATGVSFIGGHSPLPLSVSSSFVP